MPQSTHDRVAELHNLAAHAHTAAATAHGKGDHLTAHELSKQAHEHSTKAHPSWSIYFTKPADGSYGWAGADYGLWGKGVLEAIDYQTGKFKWTHELGEGGASAGVLTTDSGLLFTGDSNGNILALDTVDGKTEWHAGTGAPIPSSPITYELDGRQYVVTGSGGVLFAWALPATR